jgi:uncharacterized membrane protein YdjX (TVP38/TMEM64 family)
MGPSKDKVIESVNQTVKPSPRKISRLKYIFLGLLIVGILYLVGELSIWANPEAIKNFILKFGLWSPIILILLQVVQSMISILPSQVTTIAAGFLFGPIFGLLYALIGSTIGSAIVFLISRKYGRRLANKFFHGKDLAHFEAFFKQKKLYALFLARVAPIFPNDLVSFAAGFTKISFSGFNFVSTLGFLIQMIILVIFGAKLAEGEVSIPLIIVSVIVGLLFLVVLFKGKIRKIVIKDLKKVEKSLKKGVKIVF